MLIRDVNRSGYGCVVLAVDGITLHVCLEAHLVVSATLADDDGWSADLQGHFPMNPRELVRSLDIPGRQMVRLQAMAEVALVNEILMSVGAE